MQAVERVADALGVTSSRLDEPFMLEALEPEHHPAPFPSPITWRAALTNYSDLNAPPSPLALAAAAAAIVDVPDAAPQLRTLRSLAKDSLLYQQWLVKTQPRWQDFWALFPALHGRLTPARFFELCPQAAPRFYSISSSIAHTPGEVAITVGQLSYALPDGRQHWVSCWHSPMHERCSVDQAIMMGWQSLHLARALQVTKSCALQRIATRTACRQELPLQTVRQGACRVWPPRSSTECSLAIPSISRSSPHQPSTSPWTRPARQSSWQLAQASHPSEASGMNAASGAHMSSTWRRRC